MKAALFFSLYFLIAAVLAATVAFPLFEFFSNDVYQFERWVTRGALLFLVLGMFPCMYVFGYRFSDFGYKGSFPYFFKQFLRGFGYGVLILGVVLITLFLLENRVLKVNYDITSRLFIKAMLSGLAVAFIEETLFRGLYINITKQWHGAAVAVALSSFFYAILHFIKPYQHINTDLLTMTSGFEVIYNAFAGLERMQIDDFLALLSVGAFLAVVRLKTKSLALCIGLHASWVFLIKVTNKLTVDNHQAPLAWVTGQYDGIVGYFVFAWLLVLTLLFAWFYPKKV